MVLGYAKTQMIKTNVLDRNWALPNVFNLGLGMGDNQSHVSANKLMLHECCFNESGLWFIDLWTIPVWHVSYPSWLFQNWLGLCDVMESFIGQLLSLPTESYNKWITIAILNVVVRKCSKLLQIWCCRNICNLNCVCCKGPFYMCLASFILYRVSFSKKNYLDTCFLWNIVVPESIYSCTSLKFQGLWEILAHWAWTKCGVKKMRERKRERET